MIADEKNKYNFNINNNTEEPQRIVTSSIIDTAKVQGRSLDKEVVINKLLSESSHQKEGLPVISIEGMGGLGKTTLAQLVFNDKRVNTHFHKRLWVCVSDPFDKMRVAKQIIEASDESVPTVHSWEALHQHLSKSVEGKLFLLVLDDVWTEDYQDWEPFMDSLNSAAPGSRIVVTTRKERVAVMMGSTYRHNLQTLSDDNTWSLLSSIALFGREENERKELEEIGKKIALKCKGLPLAAKTIGGLLRFKSTKREWLNVLKNEIWKLEEVKEGVLAALLLSYYDLPSHLKCCFSYCAIFPKDSMIKREKLIGMWMAQGFLGSVGEEEMERVGGEYFDSLVMRSLLHARHVYGSGLILSYSMHDMVHDFVQFLTKGECLVIEKDAESRAVELGCSAKTRHLTLPCHAFMDDRGKDIFAPSVCKAINLRTLRIPCDSRLDFGFLFPVSLCNLTRLRSLDLSWIGIKELPIEIGKLIHLRYLDLSGAKIKELPEAVTKLYNLQSLNLTCCRDLVRLPQGIRNLKKMRQLEVSGIDHLTYLLKGIGGSTSLRALCNFIASDDPDGCKISELKFLNHLTGLLKITGLGNVANKDEATEAELSTKHDLQEPELEFDGHAIGEGEGEECYESVLNGLRPPPNLESLRISQYLGVKFPKNWMTGDDGSALSANLRCIKISDCKNCLRLSLSRLPSLEVLHIEGLPSVRYMGRKSFGISIDGDHDEPQNCDDDDDDVNIMPNLRELYLRHCSNLMVLPRHLCHAQLRKLSVSHCPALSWASSPLFLPFLEELNITGDAGVLSRSLAPANICLPSLKSLRINESWQSSLPEGLSHLTSLQVLSIVRGDNIKNLPEELQHLTMIQKLYIDYMSRELEMEVAEELRRVSHIPEIYILDLVTDTRIR